MTTQSEDATLPPPRIILGSDPLDKLYSLLKRLSRESHGIERVVIKALIAEGRRYAETVEGRRIAQRLGQSQIYKNGKIMWTIASMDEFVATEERLDAELEQPLQEILKALQHQPIEDYLMRFLEEYAKSPDF